MKLLNHEFLRNQETPKQLAVVSEKNLTRSFKRYINNYFLKLVSHEKFNDEKNK